MRHTNSALNIQNNHKSPKNKKNISLFPIDHPLSKDINTPSNRIYLFNFKGHPIHGIFSLDKQKLNGKKTPSRPASFKYQAITETKNSKLSPNSQKDPNSINICLSINNEIINNHYPDKKKIMTYEDHLKEKEKIIANLKAELKVTKTRIRKIKNEAYCNNILENNNYNNYLNNRNHNKNRSIVNTIKTSSAVSKSVRHFLKKMCIKTSKSLNKTLKQKTVTSPKHFNGFLKIDTYFNYSPKYSSCQRGLAKSNSFFSNPKNPTLTSKGNMGKERQTRRLSVSSKNINKVSDIENNLEKLKERTKKIFNSYLTTYINKQEDLQ